MTEHVKDEPLVVKSGSGGDGNIFFRGQNTVVARLDQYGSFENAILTCRDLNGGCRNTDGSQRGLDDRRGEGPKA